MEKYIKYYIIDLRTPDTPSAPVMYMDIKQEVKIGDFFEVENSPRLEDGKYDIKEIKVIDEYTVECFCEKVE